MPLAGLALGACRPGSARRRRRWPRRIDQSSRTTRVGVRLIMTSAGRLACLFAALMAAALTATLTAHVSLPNLERSLGSSVADLFTRAVEVQPPSPLPTRRPDPAVVRLKDAAVVPEARRPNIVLRPAARPVLPPAPKSPLSRWPRPRGSQPPDRHERAQASKATAPKGSESAGKPAAGGPKAHNMKSASPRSDDQIAPRS